MKELDRTISKSLHDTLDFIANKDLRIGQIFYILRLAIIADGKDFFNVENDELEIYLNRCFNCLKGGNE